MYKLITLLVFVLPLVLQGQNKQSLSEQIIGLERAALERSNNGDFWGFIELSAPEVVYFDPFIEKRSDGIEALQALYEAIPAGPKTDRYEMIDPLVQATDSMAVLTFNYKSYTGSKVHRWNCTEVYRLQADHSWKIIQTHWSLTQPDLK